MKTIRCSTCCALVAVLVSLSGTSNAQFGGAETAAHAQTKKHRAKSKNEPLIAEIRSASGDTATGDFCHCAGQGSVVKIKQALAAPLHSPGIELDNTSLSEVFSFIKAEYGIP